MSICDIQVLNLIVHYGPKGEKVFVDLLEDGLLKLLMKGPVLSRGTPSVIENVEVDASSKNAVLISGFFHRNHTVKWTYSRRGELPEKNPGRKDVYPRARFVIDVNRHLLFWITQRGESYSPRPNDFKRYLRHFALEILYKKFHPEALSAYKSYLKNFDKSSGKKLSKFRFTSDFLSEMNVTHKTFGLDLIHIVATEKIRNFFKGSKYVIEQIKISPTQPNPGNSDYDDLFPKTGKLATKVQARASITLDALDKKLGINKSIAGEVIDKNQEHQALMIEMKVKDTELENSKVTTVSNIGMGEEGVDISLKFQTEEKISSSTILDFIRAKLRTVDSLKNIADATAKVKAQILRAIGNENGE